MRCERSLALVLNIRGTPTVDTVQLHAKASASNVKGLEVMKQTQPYIEPPVPAMSRCAWDRGCKRNSTKFNIQCFETLGLTEHVILSTLMHKFQYVLFHTCLRRSIPLCPVCLPDSPLRYFPVP